MNCNVGTFDRIMRGIIAVALVWIAAFSYEFSMRSLLCITAMGIFASGLMGFCPLYFLFGIDTSAGHPSPSH